MTYDEAITRLLAQFDLSSTDAGAFLNDRYSTMVARAEWLIGQVTVALTTAGTATYTIPANVAEIRKLRVDGDVYTRVSQETLWDIADPDAGVGAAVDFLFADAYSATGQDQIQLYPAPTANGLVIDALAVLTPAVLTPGDTPVIPAEFHEGLLDGAVASCYYRTDERADLAVPHEQSYQDTTERLRRKRNSKLAPKVVQVSVAGYHF